MASEANSEHLQVYWRAEGHEGNRILHSQQHYQQEQQQQQQKHILGNPTAFNSINGDLLKKHSLWQMAHDFIYAWPI